jgi:AcrR family transcriptional regulator
MFDNKYSRKVKRRPRSIKPKCPVWDNTGRIVQNPGAQMRNMNEDRRSQRTRRLLSAALVELMIERRYDEITVQHIIDRANVGRSTFYAHYFDKEDLLVSDLTRVLDALSQHLERHEAAPGPPSLTLFFHHVQTHYQLYKALVRSGPIDLVYKKAQERLCRNIGRHLAIMAPAEQASAPLLPLVADYMAGSLLTMLKWWLDHDMPYTPEQMNALFYQLVLPGVQATLLIDTTFAAPS